MLTPTARLKHSAERVQKLENVMEKYKKKLEESAELRRLVKTLEDQNASLVDKAASLEEDYKKVSSFRPLLDSYKQSTSELEAKLASRVKEVETLKYNLQQTTTKLTITQQERASDAEALELYQEKVKELELAVDPTRVRAAPKHARVDSDASPLSPSLPNNNNGALGANFDDPEGLNASVNLGGELDDATSGRTWTDMKLEIRRLRSQIADLQNNSADASKVQVLETLLDDAKRSKARYEEEYLTTHREKLVLQAQLDEVRSGRSTGDGAEAAIALRQRLNEVVDELDKLRLAHNELTVSHESQSRELTIAKSDLNLVNKDQLEILAALRESVNEDKSGLEGEVRKLQSQIVELKEKGKMQLEQVNTLLMEKVNMQSEGMSQREKMLERERTFADLRASLNGRDLPEDMKARLLALHEENLVLKEKNRSDREKLTKAKALLKEQDQQIKKGNFSAAASSPSNVRIICVKGRAGRNDRY
ncbi:hypothetical protein DL93DRAFT_358306 [Clavulina sp. PMI_390]|nr:hypothetical protein DL93DRAFT_358306 [Clavulina sp. PMI_390]